MSQRSQVLPHTWFQRFIRPLFTLALSLPFLLFGAPIIAVNRRRLPRRGGVLVIANHQANCDGPVLQIAARRCLHVLMKREIADMGWVGKLVTFWRCIPITQNSADRGALRQAIELLEQGYCVAICPEGKVSPTTTMGEILPGVALIVRQAKVPCICAGIDGTNHVMPNISMRPQWSGKPIFVRWGEPHQFGDNPSNDEVIAWIQSELTELARLG